MHKVYENNDLMMYFRKRYCHCCGKELQRKRYERIVQRGDPDHRAYCTVGRSYKPYGDILVIGKEYRCPACDKSFSCDEQGAVIEAQKYYRRKVVTDEEIRDTCKNGLVIAEQTIRRLRWTLFVPVLGCLICMFHIFNGKLSALTERNDGTKLLLASILVFTGVALVIRLILPLLGNIDFIHDYRTVIMLITSLLSFNIPTLWYINKNFT